MPLGVNYNLCPCALGGCVDPGGTVIYSLDYCEQNGCLTILIRCVWGKEGVEGGASCPPLLLTFKRKLESLYLQSNEPPLKFTRLPLPQKPYMPPGHNSQPLPRTLGGCVNPEGLVM